MRRSQQANSPASTRSLQIAARRKLGAATLLILFAVALAVRVGWGTWRVTRMAQPTALEFPDEEQYWLMARSLHDGNGLRDELGFRATRMPLYPAFLSLFAGSDQGVVRAKAVQWAFGALAAPLTALLAHAWFSRRTAWLAGLWCAVDPFMLFFSSLLLTETVSITLLCALWWRLGRMMTPEPGERPESDWGKWALIAGLATASVYVRESSLGLVALGTLYAATQTSNRRRTIGGCAVVAAFVVLSFFPWALRNARVTGTWCWLTTRAGISLYDGVGPQATGASDLGDVKQMPEVRTLGEHAWNQYFLTESYKSMREDPARIARLAVAKIARMWNPFPNVGTHQSTLERSVSVAWVLTTLGFGACGGILLVRREQRPRRSALFFLLLPALYFSALHSFFVGSVRYRLPAMPMVEVLAAVAAVTLLERGSRATGAAVGSPSD